MTQRKKVRIDKDYCSSVVWCDGANWEESDFNFNQEQLSLASGYDDLWEEAHRDVFNVNTSLYQQAEDAKFALLKNLYNTRKDIEWCYWDDNERKEVTYYDF